MKGRKRERGGQIIVVTAIIITIIVLSIAYMISEAVNLRQRIRYEPYKEVVENLRSSFRAALAAALANMTSAIVERGEDVDEARTVAYNYLSKWKAAAMRAYADLGLELEFEADLEGLYPYPLEGWKHSDFNSGGKVYKEIIEPWDLYNLSQIYWDQSTGCSASYVTLWFNITEYGFYMVDDPYQGDEVPPHVGEDILILCNATIYPDSLKTTTSSSRVPADIVLVLDASDGVLWGEDEENDHALHLEGTIGPSGGWTTVGVLDLGEVPTQFHAVLTSSEISSLDFQMKNGAQLEIWLQGSQVPVTRSAVADSYVSSGVPGGNYGGKELLMIRSGKKDICRAWVKFDLNGLPPGEVERAILSLRVNCSDQTKGRTYFAFHGDDDWDEGLIDWEPQPNHAETGIGSQLPEGVGWITWDVTSDVSSDLGVGGDKVSSWVIKDGEEESSKKSYVALNSKESSLAEPGITLGSSLNGNERGISDTYSGEWMIQLKNSGGVETSYTIDVYARRLDRIRSAVTDFIRLLNPELDRLAIVQYGPGSELGGGTYSYHASNLTTNPNDPFYSVDENGQSSLIYLVDWADPDKEDIGYGFERYGGTLYWGGCSPIGAAIELATQDFIENARTGSQRIIIIISDGNEDVRKGEDGSGEHYYPPPYYSLINDLTGIAYSDHAITTHTIGYGHGVDDYLLGQLAEKGYGMYFHASDGYELESILSTLAYGLNDELTFNFTLRQEHGLVVNSLSPSSISVYLVDPITHLRHRAELSDFRYLGGGNFVVTVSLAGCLAPEVVEVLVMDPRGILVRLHLPLRVWRELSVEG